MFDRFKKRWTHDTEFAQAVVRLPVGNLAGLYCLWVANSGLAGPASDYAWMLWVYVVFMSCTLALTWHVYRHPGVFHLRRGCALAIDFVTTTILLSWGGEATLPVIAAVLWVSVGYGIRYGGRYLIVSAVLGQISLATVFATSAYWQQNPFQSASFVLMLLVGPSYAFALISRLKAAHDEARAANLRKSRFVAQVSHDVRQPIHAISLLAARLGDTELTDNQAKLVGSIDRSVFSATQQLQTFLNVTTIEAGLLKPKMEPVDIGKLLEEQVNLQAALISPSGNSLHAAASSAIAVTDPIFIATILQNLISNAIKHAPGSDVLIGCRRSNGQLAICVYDRGPGVDMHHVSRLTDRFFRSEASAAADGTGQGLFIVRQLAELLDLEVQIVSRKGSGTAVWIKGIEFAEGDGAPFAPPSPVATSRLNGLKVVLIDDDWTTLEATRDLLERWGCDVDARSQPSAAVPADSVVVSDFDFGDGSTLVDHRCLHIGTAPLIVVSGHSQDFIAETLRRDIVTILEKPLRAGELRSALLAAKLHL